jgi:hypothetical protein
MENFGMENGLEFNGGVATEAAGAGNEQRRRSDLLYPLFDDEDSDFVHVDLRHYASQRTFSRR